MVARTSPGREMVSRDIMNAESPGASDSRSDSDPGEAQILSTVRSYEIDPTFSLEKGEIID